MAPRGTKRSADEAPAHIPPTKKVNDKTRDMNHFIAEFGHLEKLAVERDNQARAELGDRYELYKQGTYKVIKARSLAQFDPSSEAYPLAYFLFLPSTFLGSILTHVMSAQRKRTADFALIARSAASGLPTSVLVTNTPTIVIRARRSSAWNAARPLPEPTVRSHIIPYPTHHRMYRPNPIPPA